MKKLKSYFETPKKALVSTLILLAALACLGTATVLTVNAIAQSGAIGQEKAQYLACADAGVDPASAQMFQCDFEFDHGQFVYEIEFAADGAEYEYWVKASDGTVVKKESKLLSNASQAAAAASQTGDKNGQITLEEAQAAALADAGLTAEDVTFTKGKTCRPALIQLATADTVYLIQLTHIPFSDDIADLLASPEVLKVGVAIHDDMKALARIHPFTAGGVVDLAVMARARGVQAQGLRTLAANLMGFRISKSAQCSNWENHELTAQQIKYAATDAWVGRELYFRMLRLGAAGKRT